MLIDGEKWACEACVRGHRVTTCKHHDRPLIRINRKGRPFSTCSVCHRSPCPTPDEHSKLRQADQNPANRLPPGRAARPPASFLPIAPRPASSSPSAAAPVAAAAAAGSRRDSQQGAGADRNRPVDPLMSAYPGPSVQGYGHAHGHGHGHTPGHGYAGVSRGHTHAGYSAVSHGVYPPSTLDPAQLALGASAGAYAATVPVSLPMAGGERDMFFEGGFVDDAAALEGLDLDEVLREDWSWLDSGAGAGAGAGPAPL